MKIRIKYEWEGIVGKMRYIAYLNSLSGKEIYMCQGDNIADVKREVARLLNAKEETRMIEEYEI